MSNVATNGPGVGPAGTTDSIAAAMALLRDAELVADDVRAEAERYASQREREADLLIKKARRLLFAAEAKAAVIVATARAQSPSLIDGVLDLDLGHFIAPGASVLPRVGPPSELDRLLEAAIDHAVADAFPAASA